MLFHANFDKNPPVDYYWGVRSWVYNIIPTVMKLSIDIYEELYRKYGLKVDPRMLGVGDHISINQKMLEWLGGSCERYGYNPNCIMFQRMWNVVIDPKQENNTIRVFRMFAQVEWLNTFNPDNSIDLPENIDRWIKINDNG